MAGKKMIDQKLAAYIREQQNKGYRPDTLRNALLRQGWDPTTVGDSIRSAFDPGNEKQPGGTNMINMKNPQYGGFWIRFLASFLDTLIIGIPAGLIGWGLAFATGLTSITYVIQLATVVLVVYLDGIKGGTPGKLVLGLRIVNEKGGFIGIPMAILRYIGKILSAIILGIGYLMIAWDKKKQGLHDRIAKTFVVRV